MEAQKPTALVLAATSGLGKASAAALARAGYDIVICGRDVGRLDGAVRELRSCGADVEGISADISSPQDIARLFDYLKDKQLRLRTLVANSGGPPAGNFTEIDDDDWQRSFDLVFMSAVRAIRAAVEMMKLHNEGRIIVIGSSSVRRPIPGLVTSNAMRPALAGVVKSLAVEVAPFGITVNMVCPGRIDTERVRELDQVAAMRQGTALDHVRKQSESAIPMGRYGTPDELASVVAFLASDEARYVSGQTISVDGAMTPTLP